MRIISDDIHDNMTARASVGCIPSQSAASNAFVN